VLAKNQLVDLLKDDDKAVWLWQHLSSKPPAKLGSLTLGSGNVAVGNIHIADQQLANKQVVWFVWRPVSLSIGQLQGKGRLGAGRKVPKLNGQSGVYRSMPKHQAKWCITQNECVFVNYNVCACACVHRYVCSVYMMIGVLY